MADDDTITLLLRLNKADLETKLNDEAMPKQNTRPRTLRDCKMVWKEPVLLDIGGRKFKTTLTTLHRDEHSLLAQMFSVSGFQLPREHDGSYFIDRDGEHFQHILNFLRGCFTQEGLDRATLNEIAYEAEFYQMRSLYELLRPNASARSVGTRMSSQPVGNGVLCQIGGGSANWNNPATTGKVALSGTFDGLINMIGRYPDKKTGSCHDARGKFLVLDLKSAKLRPTHCSMAYSGTCHTGASWSLHGCPSPGDDWLQLATGQVWSDDCKPQLFAVTENTGSYCQLFKLSCVANDKRSGNCFCFHVGQLELYGEIHHTRS